MPDSPQKFYLTTPIYYVNARPHIGHAYTTIVGDVLARRHRLLGEDVYFLTGTDEHGQKIERSAAAAGIPPQQFADQVSKTFSDLFARMGITNNDFIRTTDPRHIRGAQHLFSKLYKNGHIYLASYTGSYCVSDEAFIDAPVGTPCPDCGRLLEEVTEENFFFKLSAFQERLIELIEDGPNGEDAKLRITPDSARNEVLSFLRGNVDAVLLSDLAKPDRILARDEPLNRHALETGLLKISRAGKMYVPGALKDLSISRSSFTWGIPVPEPAASASKQEHVIYVWLDALANYMTALGYGAANEDGSAGDETLFKKFWPADLHLVGKEITRFHCIYWPAFLLAAGIDLPKQITANGWLLFDNAKMSKSKGNIVRTETILDAFGTLCPPPPSPTPNPVILSEGAGFHPAPQSKDPDAARLTTTDGTFLATEPTNADRDLFAADVLRYYLLREIPFGQDGSFSFDALITRYNADLANGYGNLVSRTLSMIQRYFDGKIPYSVIAEAIVEQKSIISGYETDNLDTDEGHEIHYQSEGQALGRAFSRDFDRQRFARAFEALWVFVGLIDGEISAQVPWKILPDFGESEAFERRSRILYLAAESIRIITALLYPILPYATARVWAQLGLGDIELAARNGELKDLQWGGLKPGTKLGPLAPIFPRADKGLAQIMADNEEKLAAQTSNLTSASPTPAPTTHPAAPPRTSDLPEPALTVGGSHAHTTGPADQPSHKDIPGSGIFAQQPLTTNHSPLATSEQITIDDFIKIDLRVAEIVLAERIPKADKLLRLEVDLGPLGRRQILSGIAEHYTPEELTGRRIVVIVNLAPRKMRGLESHGMLLAASDGENGKPHLATCGEDIPLGSRLK